MKKLFSYLLLSSITFPLISSALKADTNFHINQKRSSSEIYRSTVSDSITSFEKIATFDNAENNNNFLGPDNFWYDESLNKLFFQEKNSSNQYSGRHWIYDIGESEWSVTTISSDNADSAQPYITIPSSYSNKISTNTSNISTNTSSISTNKSHINSLGEGVAGSTALTAALTALPQTSKESKFSCGVGTGAYSSRYAVGFGCASKVNERVDINAGGSYVFGGSKSYGGGTLDSGVLKAGFVFKLGELNKPTQISFQDKKLIDKKISNLVKDNQNLKEKNDEIITQNQKLLARLEKLENIALKFQSSSEMISVATKD